jgi:hypothetical protein
MNFKEILKEQFKDLVTEETLTAVHEAFEQAVTEKATQKAEQIVEDKINEQSEKLQEKIELEVEAALLKVDEDHSEKLQKLIEAIDTDHTAKLQKLIEAIDTDHTAKLQKVLKKVDESHTDMLQQVIDKHETAIVTEAKEFRDNMINEVSSYLDLYLEKAVPSKQISEAVSNIQAKKTLDSIRELVAIDESYIDGEVKEALLDGKKIIDSLKNELNEAVSTNTKLNHKLNEVESNLLLEQKTKELPTSTRGYVTKLLKGKSAEYIHENFQYVVDMHEREISEKVETSKEQNVARRIVESTDRPVVEEPLNDEIRTFVNESASSAIGDYLNVMKRGDGSVLYRNS